MVSPAGDAPPTYAQAMSKNPIGENSGNQRSIENRTSQPDHLSTLKDQKNEIDFLLQSAKHKLPPELREQIADIYEERYNKARVNDAAIAYLQRERARGAEYYRSPIMARLPEGTYTEYCGMTPEAKALDYRDRAILWERFAKIRRDFRVLPPKEFSNKYPNTLL